MPEAFAGMVVNEQSRQLHLRLCREFLKRLAAHFEPLKAEQEQ